MYKNLIFKGVLLSTVAVAPIAGFAAPIQSDVSITVTTGDAGAVPTTSLTTDTAVPGDATNGTAELGTVGTTYALQEGNGESDVSAFSSGGGAGDFEMVTSTATFTQGDTNTTAGDRQYFLDFSLQGLSADLLHVSDQLFGGFGEEVFTAFSTPLPDPGTTLTPVNPFGPDTTTIVPSSVTAASFEYFIEVDGNIVYNTRADAMVSFEDGSVITGTGAFADNATLTGSIFDIVDFDVAPVSGSIALGTYGAGESLTVRSGIIARAYSHSGERFIFNPICFQVDVSIPDDVVCEEFIENGVDTFFTDPVGIYSLGSLSSVAVQAPAVPLPAAGWMLIAGLGGLVALGRRRTT